MAEISRVIDFACRRGVTVAENELSRQAEDCFVQREINLGERSESADLSIVQQDIFNEISSIKF